MKVKQVTYSFLKNLGNYSHKEVGVVVELEGDETPSEAFKRAKAFVEKALDYSEDTRGKTEMRELERVVNNPDDYAPKVVREAAEKINFWKSVEKQDDDLPF